MLKIKYNSIIVI